MISREYTECLMYADIEPNAILLYKNKAYAADRIIPKELIIVIKGFTWNTAKNDKNSPMKLHDKGTAMLHKVKNRKIAE